jgi:hypothetical protein
MVCIETIPASVRWPTRRRVSPVVDSSWGKAYGTGCIQFVLAFPAAWPSCAKITVSAIFQAFWIKRLSSQLQEILIRQASESSLLRDYACCYLRYFRGNAGHSVIQSP